LYPFIDILFLAKNFEFQWDEIFQDAKEKDLWVEPLEICKIIHNVPKERLNSVKWISRVDIQTLSNSIDAIHDDIFFGRKNSLC